MQPAISEANIMLLGLAAWCNRDSAWPRVVLGLGRGCGWGWGRHPPKGKLVNELMALACSFCMSDAFWDMRLSR